MSKSKEIRLLNDRLDYYTMEAEDDQFDAEEVIRILKRLMNWSHYQNRI